MMRQSYERIYTSTLPNASRSEQYLARAAILQNGMRRTTLLQTPANNAQAKVLAWLLLLAAAPLALALDFATTKGPYVVNNSTQGAITMNGIWYKLFIVTFPQMI
jgi:hypothetical protein